MRLVLSSIISAGLLVSGVAVQAAAPQKGEAALAKIVEHRTAGAPVDCIDLQSIASSRIVDKTAIVYTMNNGTIFVNRPTSGANFLDRGNVLVTDTAIPKLCSVDIVRLRDTSSHMDVGSVGLGKFVPYSQAKQR